MDIKLSACFIPVDDHDKALAFYRDVLGLEVHNDVGFEGMRWVTVRSPSQPDVDIVLEPPLADPHASSADKEAAAELLAKGMLRGVIFSTDDLDATFERISAAGAEVLQEPFDQPYGVRDCAFRDPSGNMLRFNQPRGGLAIAGRVLDERLVDEPLDRRVVVGVDVAAGQRGAQPRGGAQRERPQVGGQRPPRRAAGHRGERGVGGHEDRVGVLHRVARDVRGTPSPAWPRAPSPGGPSRAGWPTLMATTPPGASRERASSKNSRVHR